MRGDRPQVHRHLSLAGPFTPHARGSTLEALGGPYSHLVYPACAGIDRIYLTFLLLLLCLPRMRGDRPFDHHRSASAQLFTPHARGSTHTLEQRDANYTVYPACAGIDPRIHIPLPKFLCLPRMRGDRPQDVGHTGLDSQFTPHARGSTPWRPACPVLRAVYPACAGIDRAGTGARPRTVGLPRMRGDRPSERRVEEENQPFTPHARGSTVAFLSASW